MGIRETSGGTWISGTTSNYQVPFSSGSAADAVMDSGKWNRVSGWRHFGAGAMGVSLEGSVLITNPQVLDQIAKGAGLTPQWLARDAAIAALQLYDTAEELLADEVRGKIHVEISPYHGEGEYLVEATVRTEPTVRRTASNATIRVDTQGRLLRSNRYIKAKEVPSMTAYVAMQMHRSFDQAVERVREISTPAVQQHVEEGFRALGVKIDRRGLAHAPAGGMEFGGKFYAGGQIMTKA